MSVEYVNASPSLHCSSLKTEWVHRKTEATTPIPCWLAYVCFINVQCCMLLDCEPVSEVLASAGPTLSTFCLCLAHKPWSTHKRLRLSCQFCGFCYVLGCWFCVIGAMRPLPGCNPKNVWGLRIRRGTILRRLTARDGGLGCRRGLYGHKFVRISPGAGVGCHIHLHSHKRERERLTKWLWLKLDTNVFFKRTGAGLPVALFKDDVVGACLLIIYTGPACIKWWHWNVIC